MSFDPRALAEVQDFTDTAFAEAIRDAFRRRDAATLDVLLDTERIRHKTARVEANAFTVARFLWNRRGVRLAAGEAVDEVEASLDLLFNPAPEETT